MEILQYAYDDKGLKRVYENAQWMIGIKNWKPENDISGLSCLERHNQTDELFVLLEGECTLVYANEEKGELTFTAVPMEKGKVYNVTRSLWHNTVTKPGVKMILVEDPKTGMDNSDLRDLTEAELTRLRAMIR